VADRHLRDRFCCWWCRHPIEPPKNQAPDQPVTRCGADLCARLERAYQDHLRHVARDPEAQTDEALEARLAAAHDAHRQYVSDRLRRKLDNLARRSAA